MLSLGYILLSDLVVADLIMYSLSGMILLCLTTPFFTLKGFLHRSTIHNIIQLIHLTQCIDYSDLKMKGK